MTDRIRFYGISLRFRICLFPGNFIQHFRIAFAICFPFGHAPFYRIVGHRMILVSVILIAAATVL